MKKSKIAIVLSILLVFSMTVTALADIDTRPVNRVEFVKAILDLGNVEINGGQTSSFIDVTNPQDIPYVETAAKLGIASGYNDHFYPMATVTKEQAITMVVKSFGALDIANLVTPEIIKQHVTFKDQGAISSWAKPYVAYGVMQGIIDGGKEAFAPQSPLTLEDLEKMMAKAKTVFTREGMTASEMLLKASDKLLEHNTMKYSLKMDMKSKVIEKLEVDKEVDMVMTMLMEGAMDQENDKIHIISTTVMEAEGEKIEATTEMIMDSYVMYIKYPGVDKWAKQDINPMMQELETLLGTNMQSGMGASKQQMELFGMRATYLKEEKIDGKDHYVVFITVDKETFKAVMDQILDKALGIATQMMGVEEIAQPQEEEMKQAIEVMITEVIKNMDMEVQYKYYINKETKDLKKMDVDQVIHMVMGIMENHTTSTGTFHYYDLGKPVDIPVIEATDIMELGNMIEQLTL